LHLACRSILKVIAYFDVFNYPLKKEEIISFLDAPYTKDQIKEAMFFLLEKEIIFRFDEFFSLQNNYRWIQRRIEGNERAKNQLRTAQKIAAFLFRFPYVRSVAVSGSLSKQFADEKSDIDFFIITAPDRLWIARTFMHFFKKLTFLAGRQHWFCMNYYIDEEGFEIREKNIYTATEIVTALPLRGHDVFQKFLDNNSWIEKYFPHNKIDKNREQKRQITLLKPLAELLLNNKIGNWLDKTLMKITIKRWRKKTEQKKRNNNGVLLGMHAGKHFSKPLPGQMQEKVLVRFNLKMEQLMMELQAMPAASAV
jgi:predicted nucleotidyltransferase